MNAPAAPAGEPATGQPPQEVAEAPAESDPEPRLPRTRPADAAATGLAALAPDVEEPAAPAVPPDAVDPAPAVAPDAAAAPPPPVESEAEVAACLQRLSGLGVVFQKIDPIDPGGPCPVPAPLEVTSLGLGVAVTPKAVMNCRTAEALALWMRESVIPAARTHLNATPTEVTQASTYVCRSRNNEPGAKMSEHASANAVDIGSIGFAGRPPHSVETRPSEDPEGRFAAAIREGSCEYFTTVLGPGSDAAHATHFHFDMAVRNGGYRLCDLGTPETAERAPAP